MGDVCDPQWRTLIRESTSIDGIEFGPMLSVFVLIGPIGWKSCDWDCLEWDPPQLIKF